MTPPTTTRAAPAGAATVLSTNTDINPIIIILSPSPGTPMTIATPAITHLIVYTTIYLVSFLTLLQQLLLLLPLPSPLLILQQ